MNILIVDDIETNRKLGSVTLEARTAAEDRLDRMASVRQGAEAILSLRVNGLEFFESALTQVADHRRRKVYESGVPTLV
jgi:CheY-like chemotaxis protein